MGENCNKGASILEENDIFKGKLANTAMACNKQQY